MPTFFNVAEGPENGAFAQKPEIAVLLDP